MKNYLLFFLGAAIVFSSCHTKMYEKPDKAPKVYGWAGIDQDELKDRKIIYDASLELSVKNPDSAFVAVKNIAKKHSGYTQAIESHKTTIRVKYTELNQALSELMALGKVEWKNIRGDDVTEAYTDYKIRLDNAEKARNRYLELLNKAVTVEEIIKVEKELERLNETIDLLKGKMNRIDLLSEFSTITVYLDEKPKPGIVGYVFVGLYKGMKWLFIRN